MGNQVFSDNDLVAALNLHGRNVTRVAVELGVSRAAVRKRLKGMPAGLAAPTIQAFREQRADLFAEIQQMLLTYITPKKLKDASLQQLANAFEKFYTNERLEQGKATEHIAHAHYQALEDTDKALIKKLIAERTATKLEAIDYEE